MNMEFIKTNAASIADMTHKQIDAFVEEAGIERPTGWSDMTIHAKRAEVSEVLGKVEADDDAAVIEEIDDLDAEIAALTGEEVAPVAEAEPEVEVSDDDIEMELAKQELYAAQESEVDVVDESDLPEPDAVEAKTGEETETEAKTTVAEASEPEKATAKEGKAPRAPKVDGPLSDKVRTLLGEKADAVPDIAALDKLAVKVQDKALNLAQSFVTGKAPSRYTQIALKLMGQRTTVTVKDIHDAYLGEGLGESTARAQSQQMMMLFPALGLANRAGKELTLRRDHPITQAIAA